MTACTRAGFRARKGVSEGAEKFSSGKEEETCS